MQAVGGRRAADDLLARPEPDRPDALIISDDHIALGLAQVLSLESDYAPSMAVLTHQAAPLIFALPVLHFDLEDVRLASVAVTILLERLRYPDLPDRVEWIAPRLVDEQASSQAGHVVETTESSPLRLV